MTGFELVFAVYGLLLGLAIAEVLGGFSRILKLKRGTKPILVGWLTPLLGILVVVDLTSFWMLAYDAREQIGANYPTLLAVLLLIGIYYLAATLIFPDEPEEWPDFNDWYDKQNRMVIGGLLAANVLSWIGLIVLDAIAPQAEVAGTDNVALILLYLFAGFGILGLLIALLIVNSRRWNIAMLATTIVLLVTSGVIEPFI